MNMANDFYTNLVKSKSQNILSNRNVIFDLKGKVKAGTIFCQIFLAKIFPSNHFMMSFDEKIFVKTEPSSRIFRQMTSPNDLTEKLGKIVI